MEFTFVQMNRVVCSIPDFYPLFFTRHWPALEFIDEEIFRGGEKGLSVISIAIAYVVLPRHRSRHERKKAEHHEAEDHTDFFCHLVHLYTLVQNYLLYRHSRGEMMKFWLRTEEKMFLPSALFHNIFLFRLLFLTFILSNVLTKFSVDHTLRQVLLKLQGSGTARRSASQ